MSTYQARVVGDCLSSLSFSQIGQWVGSRLQAAGWLKTSDTGQVVWPVSSVPAANTWTLYEIRYPSSDPLQTGSTQYFLRIEYGQRSTVGYPVFRVTLGTGTDGAGNLTGMVTNSMYTGGNATGSTSPLGSWECSNSWDASRVAFLMWRDYPGLTNTCFFGIERTKANDGSDSAEGVTLLTAGPSVNYSNYQQTIAFGVGVAPGIGNLCGISPVTATGFVGTSFEFDNGIPVSPVFPCYGKWGNPVTVCALAQANDIAEGTYILTTLYGASRTYLGTKALGLAYQNQTNFFFRYD